MVPINTIKDGQVVDINTGELYDNIVSICNEHKRTNRALAFAFLLYNCKNPQINKILEDRHYFQSLHETSGKYLTIFYISQRETYFGQDLSEHNGKEIRGLHGLKTGEQLIPHLKPYFELDEKIELPAVLFFQEHNGMMVDYFLLTLDEKKFEDSFWELQTYIESAVERLERIKKENYGNSKEIFNQLKSGVTGQRTRIKFFKLTQTFPIRMFIDRIIEKV
ncbi:MAG: hypothetical protein O9294_18135 [Cytophagales bacterium]|jgi:hypothetical protein|nr:hypothetical protein [Cytophagales bacterium]